MSWVRITKHYEQHQRTGELRKVGTRTVAPAPPDVDGLPDLPARVTLDHNPRTLVTREGLKDRDAEMDRMAAAYASSGSFVPRVSGRKRVEVVAVDPATGLDLDIPVFPSTRDAADWCGVYRTAVKDAARFGCLAGGYLWRRPGTPLVQRKSGLTRRAGRPLGRPTKPVVVVDARTIQFLRWYDSADACLADVLPGYAGMDAEMRKFRQINLTTAVNNGTSLYGYRYRRQRPGEGPRMNTANLASPSGRQVQVRRSA